VAANNSKLQALLLLLSAVVKHVPAELLHERKLRLLNYNG
jgi:hypothetical protein